MRKHHNPHRRKHSHDEYQGRADHRLSLCTGPGQADVDHDGQGAQLGFRIIMDTGGNERTPRALADQLCIDEIRADVLSEDTACIIRERQAEGRKVALAGDGVNDAPGPAQANVDIAMGTGADVAIESAGFTMVNSNLDGIVRASTLSLAIKRNIKQNLLFAMIFNPSGVPIAAGVFYPFLGILIGSILAAFAMSASWLSVVMNSLRLRRVRI